MKKNNKLKTYYIGARILVDANCPIQANSLEEAIQKSKELKVSDFIEVIVEHNDSELKVTGVYEQYNIINL